MPSQWYAFTDEESGPYTFRELAEQIADEELLPSDLVRRAESTQWQRVDAVVGLMRAAHQARQRRNQKRSHQNHHQGAVRGRWTVLNRPPREQILLTFSVAGLLTCAIVWGWRWWQSPPRFPSAPPGGIVMQAPSPLLQMLPSLPATPTIPNLPKGTPVPVPGFEQVPWLKSPTLSADLLTIVYVAWSGDLSLDELLIADRKRIDEPFTNHRPVIAARSPDREAHPTLSPDGEELMFVRLGSPHQIWISHRSASTREFESATPVQLIGTFPSDHHQDAPQFVAQNTVRVTISAPSFQERTQYLAHRIDRQRWKLGPVLPFQNPWPRYYLNSSADRAVLPTESGLMITARSRKMPFFEQPVSLFDAEVTGRDLIENDDTIWVSPKEDVIFFTSAGSKSEPGQSRRLWMIRL